MHEELIFKLPSPCRDDFRIRGFVFGEGPCALAIVGALRGDEILPQYIAASMISRLKRLEKDGLLAQGASILVIPNANAFAMNTGRRFWALDGTDINRMFPGYGAGETTQRIAAVLFERLCKAQAVVQLASHYIKGSFIPHVRLTASGFEDAAGAHDFGLSYVYLKKPRPFDTTLLNYNLPIWNVKAYSLYAGLCSNLDKEASDHACEAILRFMKARCLYQGSILPGFLSVKIADEDFCNLKSRSGGLCETEVRAGNQVKAGQRLAVIADPLTLKVKEEILTPRDGTIFFAHHEPLVREQTLLFKII